jgi:autotransporter adhesin
VEQNTSAIADLSAELSDLRSDMAEGFAMANAMEVFAPDVGSNFRMNVGSGYYGGTTALGLTIAGRLNGGGTIVYLGAARAGGTTSGKAGVSFQW